jgi:hypothetical protein
MDARAVESGLDELFYDASKLSPEEAKALGVVRGMLWKVEEAERAAVERVLTGRIA